MSHELAEWVALSLVPGLGSRTLDALLAHFGTLPAVLAAEDAALQAVSGIGPRLAAAIRAVDVDRTRDEIAAWGADTPDPFGRIDIVPRYDLRYPPALRDLPDAPPVLFARGLIEAAHTPHAVAIVGTRQPHLVSRRIAAVLAQTLAAQGWAVISGLAAGIDGAAHRGTLGIGPTVAVLGCGVRMIYPPEHESLAE
ncbi:MAG: DNA-protecting protein DprA, partial [Anaerolineae bacterium]|nr:DNA-protecting protein DprA [Anaerolineae bacterium]